ncbi:MAG TPA: triose-phosphate isomerase [Thermoanaerobaculia bacterium]|nr:triose-phosphate isomerase [Thermoanaerobaculia bacterium]
MKLLVANWKMNLPREGVGSFVEAMAPSAPWKKTGVGIAPPFPFLPSIVETRERVGGKLLVGGQDCSEHQEGAFTGEVSAAMLRSSGAAFVIIGHSERRTLHGEDDALVARKVAAALAAGVRPLLCVGEDLATREGGGTMDLLTRQLGAVIDGVPDLPKDLWIAYEPVWAIGTGRNATPAMAAETHRSIRSLVREKTGGRSEPIILYGGSVKASNAAALAAEQEIEGFLVGGASLDAAGFLDIGRALEGV